MKIVFNQPITEIKPNTASKTIKYKVKEKKKSTAESLKYKEKKPIDLFPETINQDYPEIWEMFGEEPKV